MNQHKAGLALFGVVWVLGVSAAGAQTTKKPAAKPVPAAKKPPAAPPPVAVAEPTDGVRLVPPGGLVYVIGKNAVSPNGRLVAVTGQDNSVLVYEVATGRLVRRFSTPGMAWSVQMLPDSDRVIAGDSASCVSVWSVHTGKRLLQFSLRPVGYLGYNAITAVAVSPNKPIAAAVWESKEGSTLRVFNIQTGKPLGLDINYGVSPSSALFARQGITCPVQEVPGAALAGRLSRHTRVTVNALELFREVKAQGFPGGATTVRDFVRPFRDPNMPPAVLRERRAIPSPRSLAWLLVSPDRNSPKKQDLVDKLCTAVPALTQGRDLVVAFKDMLRRRACEELEGWLESAKGSGLVGFSSFVRGIRADYEAVKAAFPLEWSNGPTEGHVNRLKFIKRQGYGSASFDLLKRRVLPLTA